MRYALLLAAAVVLAACTTTPQTRDEFRTLAAGHPKFYLTGSYTANRRLEDVATTLQRKWEECYSVQRTTTRTQGGMTTSRYRDTFHPRIQKVSNSLIQMTLQQTTEGMIMLNKVPDGGEYIVVLDLERVSGNKTKLTWYSSQYAGWPQRWERNKQWSDGKDLACDAE